MFRSQHPQKCLLTCSQDFANGKGTVKVLDSLKTPATETDSQLACFLGTVVGFSRSGFIALTALSIN